MSEMMISADDHIDLGYLPSDLWTERLPSQFRERGPHVEERDGRELWICDDRVWSEWRLGKWFNDPTVIVALDRVPFDGESVAGDRSRLSCAFRIWLATGWKRPCCSRRSSACAPSTRARLSSHDLRVQRLGFGARERRAHSAHLRRAALPG